MSYELTGKLIEKFPTVQINERFKKREFVVEKVETSGDRSFTDFIKFQLVQNKTDLLDNFDVDQEIRVQFNLKGNKWEKNGKVNYITNLDAWRIEAVNENTNDTAAFNDMPPPPGESDAPPSGDFEDDLPF